MEMKLSEIAEMIDGKLTGDESVIIRDIAEIEKAKEGGDDPQSPGVLASDLKAHFLHQVVGAVVRGVKKRHFTLKPGGALRRAGRRAL